MSLRALAWFAVPLAAGLILICNNPHAMAQGEGMTWQFSEANDPDNKGRMTATLIYGVPETDNVQVTGTCDASPSSSTRFSLLRLGADVGDAKDGASVKLRFSGGGFEREIDGVVSLPQSEEGTTSVIIRPEHDDPLWAALTEKASLDYLVPGYRAAPLLLEGGKDKIQSFVGACKTYAEAHQRQTEEKPEPQAAAPASDIGEKDAFDSAKELGTVKAWEAFLKSFPKGFRADLARAYIRRLGNPSANGGAPAPAPPASAAAKRAPAAAAPPLQTVNLGPGSAPWRTGNRIVASADNQSVFAASVQGRGVELVTYCVDWSRAGGVGHGLQAVLRENPKGVYPDFEGRLNQGMAGAQSAAGGKRMQVSFSSGKTFDSIAAQENTTGGELTLTDAGQAISQGLAFKEMLGAQTMTIAAPPFSATFQLSNSRAAVCEVFKRCGATGRPECSKFEQRPKRKSVRKRSTSRCGSGSVWLEGQCVKRSDVTSFCGPGYKRSGAKCVSRYPDS